MDTPQELAFQSLGHCADYYFMYGGNADGIIAQVRDLTGHSPMLPLWAYGFFQSMERYQVADAEQKDFFFLFPFHLLPGAVYVEADACRNDGD